jgi:hypothetical protein
MQCVWITANGRHLPIGAMTTDHVRNCINMIAAGRPKGRNVQFTHVEWLRIFKTELARRNRAEP